MITIMISLDFKIRYEQPMWDKHLTGRVDWEFHTDDRLDDHD